MRTPAKAEGKGVPWCRGRRSARGGGGSARWGSRAGPSGGGTAAAHAPTLFIDALSVHHEGPERGL